MPIALVRSYAQAMDRIEAREQLALVHAHQLGAGMMKRGPLRDAIRNLEARANAGRRRVKKARPADLAALGIGFVEQGNG